MAPIDRLPTELLEFVFEYLDVLDVKHLRLMNRQHAAVGLQFLIPTVTFAITNSGLERLKFISQHEAYSRHVHGLRVFQNILAPYDDFYDWTENLSIWDKEMPTIYGPHRDRSRTADDAMPIGGLSRSSGRNRHGTPELQRYHTGVAKNFWLQYQRIKSEQEHFLSSNSFLLLIEESVSRFPKLRSIHLDWHIMLYPESANVVPFALWDGFYVQNTYLDLSCITLPGHLAYAIFRGVERARSMPVLFSVSPAVSGELDSSFDIFCLAKAGAFPSSLVSFHWQSTFVFSLAE